MRSERYQEYRPEYRRGGHRREANGWGAVEVTETTRGWWSCLYVCSGFAPRSVVPLLSYLMRTEYTHMRHAHGQFGFAYLRSGFTHTSVYGFSP